MEDIIGTQIFSLEVLYCPQLGSAGGDVELSTFSLLSGQDVISSSFQKIVQQQHLLSAEPLGRLHTVTGKRNPKV